jgi:hypothetical protein
MSKILVQKCNTITERWYVSSKRMIYQNCEMRSGHCDVPYLVSDRKMIEDH